MDALKAVISAAHLLMVDAARHDYDDLNRERLAFYLHPELLERLIVDFRDAYPHAQPIYTVGDVAGFGHAHLVVDMPPRLAPDAPPVTIFGFPVHGDASLGPHAIELRKTWATEVVM